MSLIISEHAVDNYIKRVLGLELSQSNETHRKSARDRIMMAYEAPDEIRQEEDDDCPIYIRGNIAIPVRPTPDEAIPTVYSAETFQ